MSKSWYTQILDINIETKRKYIFIKIYKNNTKYDIMKLKLGILGRSQFQATTSTGYNLEDEEI